MKDTILDILGSLTFFATLVALGALLCASSGYHFE